MNEEKKDFSMIKLLNDYETVEKWHKSKTLVIKKEEGLTERGRCTE